MGTIRKSAYLKLSINGGAMVELAIVLPVLILLMIGTVQLGRLLSQIIWSANINYEALRTGAEMNQDAGRQAMNQVFASIMRENYQRTGITRTTSNELIDQTRYDSASRSVITVSQGEAASIFDYLGLNFEASYTGPVLLTDPAAQSGDLNEFANADPECFYDCAGNCNPVPVTVPCNGIAVPTIVPPPPACFGSETPVSMADGSQKPIKSIRKGDLVLAFDPKSGQQVSARVLNTMKRIRQSYLIINGNLRVTEKHRFYVNGAWVAAEKLRPGQQLQTLLGAKSQIASIEPVRKNLAVYNFTVEHFHNYYAGGFLVHNAKIPIQDFFQDG